MTISEDVSEVIAKHRPQFPEDTRPSRLNPRSRPTVSSFDPDDIGSVDMKVETFWASYEDGAIETEVEEGRDAGEPMFTVTARVWKIAGGSPNSTAHATRTRGIGEEPYSAFPLETAESVAIGRALRFLNIRGID